MKTRRRFLGARVAVMAGAALLGILTGCVGYVGGPGGAVVVAPPPPGVVIFGGYYGPGPAAHVYSHRGYASRHGGWR